MNIDLVGIHGAARVGKGTVAKILGELYGFFDWQFAAPIYALLYKFNPSICVPEFNSNGGASYQDLQVLVDAYGWDYCKEQYPEVRRYLQVLGTEGGRMVHGEDCWLWVAEDRMLELDSKSQNTDSSQPIAFSDMRFENEPEWITKWGGINIKVVGPKRGAVSGEAMKHSSENGLPDELFDYVVYNFTTVDDLKSEVRLCMLNAIRFGGGRPVQYYGKPE